MRNHVVLGFLIPSLIWAKVDYSTHSLKRYYSDNIPEIAEIANDFYQDVWYSTNSSIDIHLTDMTVESLFPSHTSEVLIQDLNNAIYGSKLPQIRLKKQSFFEEYHSLIDIYAYMETLSFNHDSAKVIEIGKSFEGKAIKGLHISSNEATHHKRYIVVMATLHAREWIAAHSALYLAAQLLKSKNHFNFVIIPVANPDGYEYTWTTDRLWRKSRQSTHIPFCSGIDLDRNWGYEWDESFDLVNPCSESYAGNKPFEATETAAVSSFIKELANDTNLEAFIDLHSYSQTVAYPYSFSCSAVPHNIETLAELGYGITQSIRDTSNKKYRVESACDVENVQHKKMSGSALDWVYAMAGVQWAYSVRLRDKGTYGFLLPPDQIIGAGEETVSMVSFIARFLHDRYH